MSKEFIEKQVKKVRTFWNKSKINKVIILVGAVIVWPVVLLGASAYLYHKFDKPIVRWGSIALLLVATSPISAGWIGGITQSSTDDVVHEKTQKTESEGNCTGPDGKKMWLNKEDCEKFNNAWKNSEVKQDNQGRQAPTSTPQPKDAFTVLSEIGKEVTDNSNISVFDNDDGTIDVINNIVLTPGIEWGLDAYTRRWVTDYLSKTYTSGLPIRYALITIAFTGTDRDAVRVGLGVNQAENITQEQWKETNPYDLCNWIKRVSTGENQDDYANSTFADNYKCN